MTAGLLWHNLWVYSLQVLLVAGAGAIVPLLVPGLSPKVRLAYYHALLAACLLLPTLARWEQPELGTVAFEISYAALPATDTPPGPMLSLAQVGLLVVLAGCALRLAWLALGLVRLRLYRHRSLPWEPEPPGITAAHRLAGTRVETRRAEVGGPMTFGVRKPLVLLPPAYAGLPEPVQKAIALHEFLHVRRRDWAFVLGEELAGALLWFHPAVWFLLAQTKLAREQAVDREAVALTACRETYVEALLAGAGGLQRPAFSFAPLFLGRRQLARRVKSLLEEVVMSKRRRLAFHALCGGLAVAFTIAAVSIFPLQANPQGENPDQVRIDAGGRLLHRAAVAYPEAALARGVSGTVVLELSLDESGDVIDARVVSGPEELRRAALQAALTWHYAPEPPQARKVQASVEFRAPQAVAGGGPSADPEAAKAGAPGAYPSGVLDWVDLTLLPEAIRERAEPSLRRFEGRTVSGSMAAELARAMQAVDQHLTMRWMERPEGGVALQVLRPDDAIQSGLAASEFEEAFPPPDGQRLRIGGQIQARKVRHRVLPVYPQEAKDARLEGKVGLRVLIDKEGAVRSVVAEQGDPLLAQAAIDAVRQWQYETTLLNGEPVEVVANVDVNFTLAR